MGRTNQHKTSFALYYAENNRFYNAGMTLEINLYTQGKPIVVDENTTGNFINTAVSDLADFFIYIDSDRMVDIVSEAGIDIMLMTPVRDLTELKNEVKYRYRAMAEAEVSFAMLANGPYGISKVNHSGGGTEEMTSSKNGIIDNVDINRR